MKRFRKGEIFRPPTSAESAASADAIEGFRRRSPVSQPRMNRGDKLLVKTPEYGIPARIGTDISSAICTILVETGPAEEKTLVETDEEIEVFNVETTSVGGGIYVQTGLTLHGTRCVELGGSAGPATIRFEVLAAGPFLGNLALECDSVTAKVLSISCGGASVSVDDEVVIWDPDRCKFNIPIEVLKGAHGRATYMVNDTADITDCVYELEAEGDCRWEIGDLCCNEDIYA